MKVFVMDTAEEIGAAAGKIFCDFVNEKPDAVLSFATGATPVPTYDYMAEQCKEGKVSFKDITTFNLDEYCDLPKEHKNSFYMFMVDNLFSRIDVKPENINFLEGNVPRRRATVMPRLSRTPAGSTSSFSASDATVISVLTSRRKLSRTKLSRSSSPKAQ